MKVVVDTSVWSLALRRRNFITSSHTILLENIIRDGRASLPGIVRQELLSGIRDRKQYDLLREKLRAFPDETLQVEDYETAATYFNHCIAKGVQGGAMDFLICAFANRRKYQILTIDPDFLHYAKILPLALLHP